MSMHTVSSLPAHAGIGLKAEHFRDILQARPEVGFFEVHAENYMGAGGPPHRYLESIRSHYPLSVHGVGLSIGSARPLDLSHLQRLRILMQRYQPQAFSEHLAWSSHEAGFFDDLLPLPYTGDTLRRVVAHIDQTQTTLGRQMLLENPATYLAFSHSGWSETDFLAEVARRSGCALLLDINNVFVAATNLQFDPLAYLQAFPLERVEQIHLAGHARESDEHDRPLLIDTHDRPVIDAVWALYDHVLSMRGPVPTLIEWDANLPALPVLLAEADHAEARLAQARPRVTLSPTLTATQLR
ncbi:DUF692 domain-containing protein [Pseudoxanthomonas sp.]|uniref:MNIO family bufferin maturase n=1 Tax=Pseudoxanthomonas sp. TaxID=1871049 RepID=UPI00260D1974|nr:DUF692 domain-containing protein [Pseudoxanthomonas sp.]WDS35812.1 MAG: DUF692 domain-containing protein [Pseudoxanthomonas sp.]